MPAGRPRKPHNLRLLEGKRGHSRALTKDLAAPAGQLVPPKGLSALEREQWKLHAERVRSVKLESPVDSGQFLVMIRMCCRALQADAVIAKKGPTYLIESQGIMALRPEVGLSKSCWSQYLALCPRFGLDAQARAKMGGNQPEKPEEAGDVPASLKDVGAGRPTPNEIRK